MKKKLPRCNSIATPPKIPLESQTTSLNLCPDCSPLGRRVTHGIGQTSYATMDKQCLGS